MLDNVLKTEIDEFAERLRASNRLFQMAREGRMARATVLEFLRNIHYVLREAPSYLTLAFDVATARGQGQLAEFYKQKLGEETGHDRWAEQDLKSLNAELDAAEAPTPRASLTELIAFLKETIQAEPARLLVYLLFAEYFTVKLGPEWVLLLDEKCGIPSAAMSSIAKHAELDKDHAEHDLESIRDLMPASAAPADMLDTLHRSMAYWERFYDELAGPPN
jgi:hypothetical protein